MTRRRLLYWVSLSLLSYLLFFFLFPRTNPSAKWRHELDRTAAINVARETAKKFGIETAGWTTLVTTSSSSAITSSSTVGRNRFCSPR